MTPEPWDEVRAAQSLQAALTLIDRAAVAGVEVCTDIRRELLAADREIILSWHAKRDPAIYVAAGCVLDRLQHWREWPPEVRPPKPKTAAEKKAEEQAAVEAKRDAKRGKGKKGKKKAGRGKDSAPSLFDQDFTEGDAGASPELQP